VRLRYSEPVGLTITPEELEAARLAFVVAWDAVNDGLRRGRRTMAGERSHAGLVAALDALGIEVES
jgi:hypothetical protein